VIGMANNPGAAAVTPHFMHDPELFESNNFQTPFCKLICGGTSHAACANDCNVKRFHSAEC
jgi:hypothetical protein